MLIQNCVVNPTFKKTAKGGRKIAVVSIVYLRHQRNRRLKLPYSELPIDQPHSSLLYLHPELHT